MSAWRAHLQPHGWETTADGMFTCTRTDSELGRSVIVDGVIGCVPMKYSIDLSPLGFQFDNFLLFFN